MNNQSVIFPYKTIQDVDLDGKQILMRADYNVPLTEDGRIADDYRITASLPTLHYLIEHGAKIVIIAHLGRPKSSADVKYSLAPVAVALSNRLGRNVRFVHDCIGADVLDVTEKMQPGDVVLLENLRFHPEEKADDPDFAMLTHV